MIDTPHGHLPSSCRQIGLINLNQAGACNRSGVREQPRLWQRLVPRCCELYFCANDWHLSINACRSASVLKTGRIACIPAPEQFVEFISGAPPLSQPVKAAVRPMTNTIYLEFIISFSLNHHNTAQIQLPSATTSGRWHNSTDAPKNTS